MRVRWQLTFSKIERIALIYFERCSCTRKRPVTLLTFHTFVSVFFFRRTLKVLATSRVAYPPRWLPKRWMRSVQSSFPFVNEVVAQRRLCLFSFSERWRTTVKCFIDSLKDCRPLSSKFIRINSVAFCKTEACMFGHLIFLTLVIKTFRQSSQVKSRLLSLPYHKTEKRNRFT